MTIDLVIDHLWQSTLVASALALLTLAFRRAHAQARYAIWLAASLKFLIPFAALTSLGAQLEWRAALPLASPEWTAAIEAVRQSLATPPVGFVLPQTIPARTGIPLAAVASAIWAIGFLTSLGVWLVRWRRVSRAVRAGAPIVSGRTHDTFQALASTTAPPLVASDTSLEPGVFGILRPVLLWPREIDLRLDNAQVRAVLAHELAHVHWRDNLTAAMHTGRLLAHGVGIDQLARSIGGLPAITAFNRIVVNETKLEGQYDFDFRWTNEFGPRGGPLRAVPAPPPAGPGAAPGDEPTLVTALQEQLGLKLDPRRSTVDVLVIDSVEKPGED
jgi:hypothetical protein